jgi:nucleoid-associated protein YgaU
VFGTDAFGSGWGGRVRVRSSCDSHVVEGGRAMSSGSHKADFPGLRGGSSVSHAPRHGQDHGGVNAGSSAAHVAEQTYTVVAGDTLSKIAKKFYGNTHAWDRIFKANRDKLNNPDLIRSGQVLRIPAK